MLAGGLCWPQSIEAAGVGKGVSAKRLARLSKGANVCRWFRFPKENTTDHYRNYITESEAFLMAEMGLKHVRLCVVPKFIMDVSSGEIRTEAAQFVDAAIQRFHKAGLMVMVDLHNEDRVVELNPEWQEAFVRFWGAYARRLSRFDPDLTLLETVNEPVFERREAEWTVFNERLIANMRKNAPKHTLVTSGPNWGGIDGLRKIKPLADGNIVYSFHCYDPFTFTHQGATWAGEGVKPLRNIPYPSSPEAVVGVMETLHEHPASKAQVEKYGREGWNRDKLAARFRLAIEWGSQQQAPLYCGEFGVYPPHTKPEHRAQWFQDFGGVLAENKIGWAVWGWDEGFGLDRQFKNGKPVTDAVVAKALGLKAG